MIQVVKESTTDYHSFIQLITSKVKKLMGESYTVQIYKVMKNNSLELDCLIILKDGQNFAPNIYLMPYYESYLEGTSIDELTERLCCIYRHCTVPIIKDDFHYTLDEMKDFIVYRLVNYERNKKLLKTVPHIKQFDLAVTFHCLVRDDGESIGTIRITNDHMKLWDIKLTELYKLANYNTSNLFPASIRSMEEVMKGMLFDEFHYEEEEDQEDLLYFVNNGNSLQNHNKMYILSNQKGINGATCLLYNDVLREFSRQLQSDLYILPSSIHEIILVPSDTNLKRDLLTDMVRDINRTQVPFDEVLSDTVYYFSREKNEIVMQ